MGPSEQAVEAAAETYREHRMRMWKPGTVFKSKHGWHCQCGEFLAYGESQSIDEHSEHVSRAALSAALPIIRQQIAEEIREHMEYATTFGPDEPFLLGLNTAAGIVRGDQEPA